jgi:hypothetical protein
MGTSEQIFRVQPWGGGGRGLGARPPLDPPLRLKTAGSQLKRLTSTGHHMELVKHVAIARFTIARNAAAITQRAVDFAG